MAAQATQVVNLKKKFGQECDVYIGRRMFMGGHRLMESQWANPFKLSQYKLEDSLLKYWDYVTLNPLLMDQIHELEGKRLGCWCVTPHCAQCGASRFPTRQCGHLECHGDMLAHIIHNFRCTRCNKLLKRHSNGYQVKCTNSGCEDLIFAICGVEVVEVDPEVNMDE